MAEPESPTASEPKSGKRRERPDDVKDAIVRRREFETLRLQSEDVSDKIPRQRSVILGRFRRQSHRLQRERINALGFPYTPPPASMSLQGIGGTCGYVLVRTVLELTRDDGGPADIRGEFAAFIDPTATDLSILGRDVLNHFDVILSHRRNEVLLLAPNHQYRIDRI